MKRNKGNHFNFCSNHAKTKNKRAVSVHCPGKTGQLTSIHVKRGGEASLIDSVTTTCLAWLLLKSLPCIWTPDLLETASTTGKPRTGDTLGILGVLEPVKMFTGCNTALDSCSWKQLFIRCSASLRRQPSCLCTVTELAFVSLPLLVVDALSII